MQRFPGPGGSAAAAAAAAAVAAGVAVRSDGRQVGGAAGAGGAAAAEGGVAITAATAAEAARQREEGVRLMAEVSRALDNKAALVAELRSMNDLAAAGDRGGGEGAGAAGDAEGAAVKREDIDVREGGDAREEGGGGRLGEGGEGRGGGGEGGDAVAACSTPSKVPAEAAAASPSPGGALDPFQRQYASTMLRIRECNQQLQGALVRLREQHSRHEVRAYTRPLLSSNSTACGIPWVISVAKSAQVELSSGRVYTPDTRPLFS